MLNRKLTFWVLPVISLFCVFAYGDSLTQSPADAVHDSSHLEKNIDTALVRAQIDSIVRGRELSQSYPRASEIEPAESVVKTPDETADEKSEVKRSGVIRSFLTQTSRLFSWLQARLIKLFILGISLTIIGATVFYLIGKKDSRRFLTTTRLSVLDKMVQRACLLIENNYSQTDLCKKRICEELVTGEAFLEALFQKNLGIGVNDFINQVRINNAKNFIAQGLEIETTSNQCGFSDEKTLIDTFKKVTGVSIGDYKENTNASTAVDQENLSP
ncbi:helix-turn-helix domain-containing protein [Chitinispirillales bacterium ANBcel5]|uniref:helix-turn-helix domain-containing protein n=1 Tax=Cellulosispirillum alkaliphilum TaxID=3039283 RepID=UPI002A58D4BB|nr:helix-turn-helix domain-containing protein [Chitinispirillales bacterium ANBcel5]